MKISVLIVEDDLNTRHGLVEILRREGFIVHQAADGMAGWEEYQSKQPDFVCLDVMMAGLSGYELCRRIRIDNQNVPIIFLTAKGEETDRVVGLEIGADDYITKPFSIREVIARIRAVSRRALQGSSFKEKFASEQVADFMMADLHIHPRQLRCRRDGGPWIDLSLRDLKILTLLFKHRDAVVSRREMMHECWEQTFLPTSRSLDQHISQLRKRIEVDPKQPQIIATVHGIGYRYETRSEVQAAEPRSS